jgi:hypothetical protein
VAACRIRDIQLALHKKSGAEPTSALIRIADRIGPEQADRFVKLQPDDKVDVASSGLSLEMIAKHSDLFRSRVGVLTRKEAEEAAADAFDKAKKEAEDKADEWLANLDPAHGFGRAAIPRGVFIPVDDRGLDLLCRVANSEVGHFGRYGDEQLNNGLAGVVDTIINRVAHPRFKEKTLEEVVNKPGQFSAVNKSWEMLLKANEDITNRVIGHVVARSQGKRSLIKGAVNFLNPYISSATAMAQWGDYIFKHPVAIYGSDAKHDVHYHGFAPGLNPPSPYTLGCRGNTQFFSGEGEPLATPAASQGLAASIIAGAQREWLRWGKSVFGRIGHRESEGEFAHFILDNYCPTVNATPTLSQIRGNQWHWSAAFVSFVLMQAGVTSAQFPFNASHSVYIRDAIRRKKSNDTSALFWGYRVDDAEAIPRPGDIIGAAGHGQNMTVAEALAFYDKTGEYESHCDIVVATRPGQIDVIGGTVSQSVTMQTLQISPDGRLDGDGSHCFVVMKLRPASFFHASGLIADGSLTGIGQRPGGAT